MSSTITFTGWDAFIQKAQNLPQILFEEIDGECEDAAAYWEELSKNDAPKDTGRLYQNITKKQLGLMHYEVVDPIEYAAFREWGTGALVSVPSDLREYAITFKGAGIRQVNSRPHPYFFIQQPIVEKYLFENIKNNIIEREH